MIDAIIASWQAHRRMRRIHISAPLLALVFQHVEK
jgi:hypothetical protein